MAYGGEARPTIGGVGGGVRQKFVKLVAIHSPFCHCGYLLPRRVVRTDFSVVLLCWIWCVNRIQRIKFTFEIADRSQQLEPLPTHQQANIERNRLITTFKRD